MGVKVKLNVPIATDALLFLANDHITQVFLPKKAREEWDKVFITTNVKRLDPKIMSEAMLNHEFSTVVLNYEDADIARLLRK
jgi:hypothetical protein